MTARILCVFILGFLSSTFSKAQELPTSVENPEISGRTIHASTREPVEGVKVVLYTFSSSDQPLLSEATTDNEGRFLFKSTSNSPEVSYLLGARYKGIPFPGAQVSFNSGEKKAFVEIVVSDARPDPSGLKVDEVIFRFDWQGRRLIVNEEIHLTNPLTETFFVAEDIRALEPPLFKVPLANNTENIAFPFGVDPEGVIRGPENLNYYGPIYPGKQIFRFGFMVNAKDQEVSLDLPLLKNAKTVTLLNPSQGPALKTLKSPSGVVEIDEREYQSYQFNSEDDSPIQISFVLPDAEPEPDRARIKTGRWIIERDPVIIRLSEEYKIYVSGTESVYQPSGSALIKVDLPDGAKNIRFLSGGSPTELRVDKDGSLALDGPLHPGETNLSIQYEVPTRGSSTRIVRNVPSDIETLEVFVVDDGQTHAHSPQLHRKRPIKTADRNYISLESFSIGSGQILELNIDLLKIPESMPKFLFLSCLLAGTLGIVFLISSPLLGGKSTFDVPSESPLEREQIALLASLRDLEHDFETGKISAEDHRQLRDSLRYRTSQTYEETSKVGTEKPPETCASCGKVPPQESLFCPQCGAQLTT